MGSLPRIQIKDELRYRKGSTNEAVNCRACEHFVPSGGAADVIDVGRCRIFGMKESIRYRVRASYTCDAQAMSGKWREEVYCYLGRLADRLTEKV